VSGEWAAKRFWETAAVVPVAGGFTVELDGRGIKTPAKTALVVPTQGMAEAIAAEWDAQVEKIDPMTMPMTRSANAALDKVSAQHGEVADMLADYGDSDLLCYRAATPVELVARQSAVWDPLLAWAAQELGAKLEPRAGVLHVSQAPETLAKLRALVHEMDDFQLAGFHDLVMLSGSLIIGFAAIKDANVTHKLWEVSRLDEIWQRDQWGEDDEAEANAAIKAEAFLHAKRFFDLAMASERECDSP